MHNIISFSNYVIYFHQFLGGMSFVGTRKASVEPDEDSNDAEDDEIIYLDENNQYGKGNINIVYYK